jgi:hypothetical protein
MVAGCSSRWDEDHPPICEPAPHDGHRALTVVAGYSSPTLPCGCGSVVGWYGRPTATVLLIGLIPLATVVPALMALGLVAAVCATLILYEALRYREHRAWIRSRRGVFTMEEARVRATRRRTETP